MLERLVAAFVMLLLPLAGHAQQQPAKVDAIIERMTRANQWRDHVMVVGHRGGVREMGVVVRPENSLEAIEAAVAMGLEMVELDVQKTRDGVYVVLHDSWLDRTTTCKGRLVERDLANLENCRLRRGDFGPATEEGIPTLQTALQAARGRILVNIDNKLELTDLTGMVAIAAELGVERQLVIKQNLWSDAKVDEARALLTSLGSQAHFMPIVADDAVEDPGFVDRATKQVDASVVEMVNWRRESGAMTAKGGALFTPRMRAVAARNDFHLWVNTYGIVNKPAGYLSGGRGDELATIAANPDDVYGFWIDRGVTIIQTDEPKAAIDWLEKNGYRRPYETEPEATASIY
jgi:glycerophosphoryl diester phosphodiesterase